VISCRRDACATGSQAGGPRPGGRACSAALRSTLAIVGATSAGAVVIETTVVTACGASCTHAPIWHTAHEQRSLAAVILGIFFECLETVAAGRQQLPQVLAGPPTASGCAAECHDAPTHAPKARAHSSVPGRFILLRIPSILYTAVSGNNDVLHIVTTRYLALRFVPAFNFRCITVT
jgi:hypothetical protein